MENEKQTNIDLVIKYIEEQQENYLKLLKTSLKGKSKEVDAILTATTLIIIKCKEVKKIEEENAFKDWLDNAYERIIED